MAPFPPVGWLRRVGLPIQNAPFIGVAVWGAEDGATTQRPGPRPLCVSEPPSPHLRIGGTVQTPRVLMARKRCPVAVPSCKRSLNAHSFPPSPFSQGVTIHLRTCLLNRCLLNASCGPALFGVPWSQGPRHSLRPAGSSAPSHPWPRPQRLTVFRHTVPPDSFGGRHAVP